MGLCLGGGGGRAMTRPPPVVHMGHQQVSVAAAGPPMCPAVHTGAPPHPHRRPLLLQVSEIRGSFQPTSSLVSEKRERIPLIPISQENPLAKEHFSF